MKTNNFNINYIAIVALFFTIFSSCSMIKELEYEVTQDPLHMKGGDVTLQINGKFIEKGLNAKAVAEITPIFFCNDGNEIPFQTEIYQGPKAAGNGKVVPSTGLQFSYTSTIPYQKSMDEGEVKVKVLVKMGSKTEDIMSPKIADGTIITSKLIVLDDHVISSSECNFKRINSFTKSATINFSKGKHNISSKELRDSDVKDLLTFISSSLDEDSRIDIKSIQISSFASPEGEVDLNDNLAQDRGNSTMKSLISKSKRMKFDLGKESSFYNVVSKGEDWEGFNKLMRSSDIKDRRRITKIVNSVEDLEKREQAIRDMAEIYDAIEKDVLPQLRKAKITIRSFEPKRTDNEILDLAQNNAEELDIKELLFSASLTENTDLKVSIFNKASEIHNNWKGYNNIAYLMLENNKIEEAKKYLSKAEKLNNSASNIQNNKAVIAAWEGDFELAKQLYNKSATPKNKALLDLRTANYKKAARFFKNKNTHNAALAKMLNGQNSTCNENTAACNYLNAISYARSGDENMMIKSLNNAIVKNNDYKNEAKKDLEFINYRSSDKFLKTIE